MYNRNIKDAVTSFITTLYHSMTFCTISMCNQLKPHTVLTDTQKWR